MLLLFWTRLNEVGCVWPQLTTMQRQGGRSPGSQDSRTPPPVSHRGLPKNQPRLKLRPRQLFRQHLRSDQRTARCAGLVDVTSKFQVRPPAEESNRSIDCAHFSIQRDSPTHTQESRTGDDLRIRVPLHDKTVVKPSKAPRS